MGLILDLGCGRRKHAGAIGVDNVPLETVDVVHDLRETPYPFACGCADEIILSHVLEHFSLAEINCILDEAHRVLGPTGLVTISVPPRAFGGILLRSNPPNTFLVRDVFLFYARSRLQLLQAGSTHLEGTQVVGFGESVQ